MRWTRLIPVFSLLIVVAACGETGGDLVGPGDPRMNGGLVVGGNRTGSDTTSTTTTTQTAPSDSTGTGSKDDNGGLVVGGN